MSKDKGGGEMLLVVAAGLPSMLIGLFRSYLRMKRQAKLAGKEFYRSLVEGGVPPRYAQELCDEYTNAFSIITILKDLGH